MADQMKKFCQETESRPTVRPLFAAAASNLHDSKTDDYSSRSISHNHGEDLASLQLDLATSTMDAILAAQRPTPQDPKKEDSESESEKVDVSDPPRKRKSSVSEDASDSMNEASSVPKKKKRKKERKNKKKKKKKHRHDHRSRSRSEEESKESPLPYIPKTKVFLDDIPNLKPQHAFRVDREENKDLYYYKSVSKQHIPKYKQKCFNCLGNFDLFLKSDKQSVKSSVNSKSTRYFGKESRRLSRTKGIHVSAESSNREDTLDTLKRSYIRIPQISKEDEERISKNKKEFGSYSCLDEATLLYSQGKGTEYSKPPEVDMENFVLDEIFQKVAFYNQKTREDPQNVQLWLDFVSFQDIAAQENKSRKGEAIRLREVYQPSRAVIEKKLSILEKALEANPSTLELKLAQLELYQDIWDEGKLEKAWEDLLFIHSANVDVWRQYLSRQQTRLSKFTFNSVVKLYHKCFKTLTPILDGSVKVASKPSDLEEKMIDLFSQYCDFLLQCGYSERAISSYQAMIELNLYCPTKHNLGTSAERTASFEEFWESGVAKFGEEGAKGWSHWVERKNSAQPQPGNSASTDDQEDAIILKKLNRSQTWLALEKLRQRAHMLPWRPDASKGETEESVEDLDRLVLVDDISPALFNVYKSDSCMKLVCFFLKFLGLDVTTKLHNIFGEKKDTCKEFLQFSVTSENQIRELTSFKLDVDSVSNWKPDAQLISFLRNVLQQAESYFGAEKRTLFTQMRLELEVQKSGVNQASELSKTDVKQVLKFGKSVLKEHQNRSNLKVWDAYIRLHWACSDKMAETISMIETALGMFMGSGSSMKDNETFLGLCYLSRTYSQILLNFEPLEHVEVKGKHSAPSSDDKRLVMTCLGNLFENKPFKSTQTQEAYSAFTLRIQKRFQNKLKELIESLNQSESTYNSQSELISIFTDCFALFEFCSSNLRAANLIYKLTREAVQNQNQEKNSSLVSSLYLFNIRFVTNVMHIASVPLTTVRSLVEDALQKFPENTQLLSAFIKMESGSYIAGRMRKYFERRLKNPSSVLGPLFAVIAELLRHQMILDSAGDGEITHTALSDSGTVHRVRSVFEQALQRPACRHCPLLWRLYLYFESKWGSASRSKGILYRGLQSCPWVKELFLDGVGIFGDAELQEMTDLMTEKEIRVRMPPEEADMLVNAEREEEEEDVVVKEEEGESEGVEEVKLEDPRIASRSLFDQNYLAM